MATSTMFTYLMVKESATYKKLVDIKDFPDLGGAPETLETTTLSDKMQTNILGIQSMDAMEFTCNYTPDDYEALSAIALTDQDFAIWFGGDGTPSGDLGKFEFKGQLSVYIAGAGVNAVREMKVSIAASTEVKKASA